MKALWKDIGRQLEGGKDIGRQLEGGKDIGRQLEDNGKKSICYYGSYLLFEKKNSRYRY